MASASRRLRYLLALYIYYVVAVEEVNTLQQDSENEQSLEYRLTKLLDIRVGEGSENLHSDLRNNIRSQVQRALADIGDELVEPPSLVGSASNRKLQAFIDNMTDKFHELVLILKELNSQLLSIKGNISSVGNPSSVCRFNDNIKNLINKSPVGVSYDRQCLPITPKNALTAYHRANAVKEIPKSCKEILQKGNNVSGIYEIQPTKSEKPFMVLCDMETRGGGWTHIHKRFDGSQDFYLDYREFKFGFGDLEGEFWIGLQNMHTITDSEVNELLVELVDRDGAKAYAHYKAFKIGPETTGYPLSVLNGFSGDAGDSLTHHVGAKFTTKDFDQDGNPANCAQLYSGAWWHKSCHIVHLNGKYLNVDLPVQYKFHGIHWAGFRSHEYCQAKARMMVRPA